MAEVVQEISAERRKRGRPRKTAPPDSQPETPFDDPTTGNSGQESEPSQTEAASRSYRPIPKPPTFRFDKDNPKKENQPAAFLQYWHSIEADPDFRPRLVAYVYRLWPKLARTGVKYEAVLPQAPAQFSDLLLTIGSGIYRVFLNQQGERGKPKGTLAQCIFQVEDAAYPPAVDPKEVDMSAPENKAYITRMRAKGVKFPGDAGAGAVTEEASEEGDEMASASKLAEVIDNLTRRQQNGGGESSRAVEVVASAAEKAQDIIQVAMRAAAENGARAGDPIANIAPVLAMAKDLVTATASSSGAAMSQMIEQMRAQNATMMEVTARMHEAQVRGLEEQVRMLQTARAEPAKTVVDQLEEMRKWQRIMEDMTGKPEQEEPRRRSNGGFWDSPLFASIASEGMRVLGAIAQVMLAGQQQQQQPQHAQQAGIVPVGSGGAGGAGGMMPNDMTQQQPPQAVMFLRMIETPLVKALTEGGHGGDFAAWMLEGYGKGIYEQVTAANREELASFICATLPVISQYRQMNPEAYERFLTEFYAGPVDEDGDEAETAGQAKMAGAVVVKQ